MTLVSPPRLAGEQTPETATFNRDRARVWAVVVALVAASFAQAPGSVAADTKLDLYENPWGLLRRAVHMWDPQTASGALQNQAYGYLFPQGPFFGVLESLGLPGWVAQRLWWALLLTVAFLGMRRLLAVLGVGGDGARIFGGLLFALSPRIVSALGELSSEVWPMAMAPWVLVPLVRHGLVGGDPRRTAARSGAAFLAVGAVNAVASLAVIVLPVVYLLTRRWNRDTARLAGWWLLAMGLASLWWFVPLVLLGRYSPPFLDWIESSAVTTGPDSLANATRGTTAWLAYLAGSRGPSWPAGWQLVTQPVLILDTAIISALGVAGLIRRGVRERLFLVTGALVGVVLLSIAWVGPFGSPFAESVRTFLDGAGSPLRNIHKFDLVLRIPLVIGATWVVSQVRLRPLRQVRWGRYALPVIATVALVGAATPGLTGQIGASPGYVSVPDYWRQAATWIDAHAGATRSLVVPGAQPTVYYWGTTGDDALQPLLTSAWAVRDGVPLGSAGNTRMLDAVEGALATGRGSAGLPAYLARAGVGLVVERNDLDWARIGTTRPLLVHAALSRSGLVRVATFGPTIGGSRLDGSVIDGGLSVGLPAVEVWSVPGQGSTVVRGTDPIQLAGGPEDTLSLDDADVAGQAPVVLAGDGGSGPVTVVTDGYRRREVDFGSSRANATATMTVDEPFRAPRRVHDYWPIPPTGRQSTALFPSGTPEASTSGATSSAQRNRSNGWGPPQAFDHDLRTEWRSSARSAVGQWVGVRDLPRTTLGTVRVTTSQASELAGIRRLTVTAGDRIASADVDASGVATVDLGSVTATALRVTVDSVQDGQESRPVGIRDVELGVTIPRWVTPAASLDPASTLVASVPRDRRDGCVFDGEQPYCTDLLPRPGEEDDRLARRITVSAPGRWTVRLTARAAGGPALDQLLVPVGQAMFATASSQLVLDPAGRPQAAVDRDPRTSWVADRGDGLPRLTLTWPAKRRITGFTLVRGEALAASTATRVLVVLDGGSPISAPVDAGGHVRVPPTDATSLQILASSIQRWTSLDPSTGRETTLPWGVSEVTVDGADDFRRSLALGASTGLPCGFGPALIVDGRSVATRIDATVGDLLQQRPVTVLPCGSTTLSLGRGTHDLSLVASQEFVPERLVLTPGTTPSTAAPRALEPSVWGPTHREIPLSAGSLPSLLVVRENANAGWMATVNGAALEPARADGWEQAWWVPAGMSGTVDLDYRPDGLYRAGLVIGLLAALALLVMALRRSRAQVAGPLRPRRVPRLVVELAGPTIGLVVAGLVGLAIGVAARLLIRRAGPVVAATVAGSCVAVAGAVAAVRPWPGSAPGAFSPVAQLAGVIAITLLASSGGVRRSRAADSTSADEPA